MPLAIATAAIDMLRCMQEVTALALDLSLCTRRRRRAATRLLRLVFTCPSKVDGGHDAPMRLSGFKMP